MEPVFMDVNNSFGKEIIRLDGVAKRLEDVKPVLGRIGLDILEVERKVFASRGRRGGGSWKALKPDTIRKKGTFDILRTVGAKEGYSSIGDNALYKSVTEPHAPFQVWALSKNRLIFGTDRPYAGVHQEGSLKRNIPARPFLKFLDSDTQRWNRMIGFYITQPHRK